ncbi:GFA family protein [Ensifer soli]|uniref:GFA family protein n=1 Tax=Ciceribacter sp. sgz301302 TaxID=3342379 RepID=UPI0035B6F91A
MNAPALSGGCQCGAVRFRVEGTPGDASVCHCRMCQKAAGNVFLPLVSLGSAALTFTRGQPKRFRSSNAATRGFCADCGTPLTYEAPDGVALAIGAFDRPEGLAPSIQWGIEAKLAYVDAIPSLPAEETLADQEAASFLSTLVSYQHPDHDTDAWPLEERR